MEIFEEVLINKWVILLAFVLILPGGMLVTFWLTDFFMPEVAQEFSTLAKYADWTYPIGMILLGIGSIPLRYVCLKLDLTNRYR